MSSAKCSMLLIHAVCLTVTLPNLAFSESVAPPVLAAVPTATPQAIPDSTFRAVMDRSVALLLADGSELVGRILAVEPDRLVVADASTGQLVTLPRARVASVHRLDAAPLLVTRADSDQSQGPMPPRRQRHFAINLGILPSIDLDLDYGLFHGFANLGAAVPLATQAAIWPFALGLGLGIPVARRHPALKLDLFGYGGVVWSAFGNTDYADAAGNTWRAPIGFFGVGLGLHHTWSNAVTLGFTVPLMGYSIAPVEYSWDHVISGGISFFFLASSEALPLVYLGKRF